MTTIPPSHLPFSKGLMIHFSGKWWCIQWRNEWRKLENLLLSKFTVTLFGQQRNSKIEKVISGFQGPFLCDMLFSQPLILKFQSSRAPSWGSFIRSSKCTVSSRVNERIWRVTVCGQGVDNSCLEKSARGKRRLMSHAAFEAVKSLLEMLLCCHRWTKMAHKYCSALCLPPQKYCSTCCFGSARRAKRKGVFGAGSPISFGSFAFNTSETQITFKQNVGCFTQTTNCRRWQN
jgi:hypothetical protein